MNIIQARLVNQFGDGYGKKYTFHVPDGVRIEKGALLLAEKNGGKDGIQIQIVGAVTSSAEVTDEVLDMIMDGKQVISSIIGVYKLKGLKPEEQKEPEDVDWSKVAEGKTCSGCMRFEELWRESEKGTYHCWRQDYGIDKFPDDIAFKEYWDRTEYEAEERRKEVEE